MKKNFLSFLIPFFFCGCFLFKGTKKNSPVPDAFLLPDVAVDTAPKKSLSYQPSATRNFDLLHTKLNVSFDWEKQYLCGKAVLTLTPYFYPSQEIVLDAKGFEIKNVSLLPSAFSAENKDEKALPFSYNKSQLSVTLDKEYTRSDTFNIFIDYISKPNEREIKGGQAITSDKGLYFINPLGKEKDKPVQIWTQGEPESSSCWFPTIDKPNERMTQEIFIALDSAHSHFITLSNGKLVSSVKNPDGSRTDYWKQSLPAAPYLTMMAIGDYAVVKDTWRNIEVNYYVEKEYEPYAKEIFGNTPEMLEFFSNKLGVPYPWEKYSQIVDRDYVSGAMENTTAVIHGQFMQQTSREMLDRSNEDVISHELFHHWFGNLVTCESWANLTLNEGFATYGEYLWNEYKYGRDAADQRAYESMRGYLSSAGKTSKHLIRFYHNDPDDMFDSHSYNKGGAVLHMLRKYTGDEAFFSALKLYLETNKFSSVEVHELRLAFEKVTGEDLHWFFDQWFLDAGHPKLLIQHFYNDSLNKYFVGLKQIQDTNPLPVFRFPLDVDIYFAGKKERKRLWVNSQKEDFVFDAPQKPDLVNVDAEKSLLCVKEEKKSVGEWTYQYHHCPLYTDRLEAVQNLSANASLAESAETLLAALDDKNYDLRIAAIGYCEKLNPGYKNRLKEKLILLASSDEKADVRAAATDFLSGNFADDTLLHLYREKVNDKSYSVSASALAALARKKPEEALVLAKTFEKETSLKMLLSVADIYAGFGNDANNDFFLALSEKMNGWNKISFAVTYTDFLKRCSDPVIDSGIKLLENIRQQEDNKWIRYFCQKGIKDIAQMYADREKELQIKISRLKEKTSSDSSELQALEKLLVQTRSQKQKLNMLVNSFPSIN